MLGRLAEAAGVTQPKPMTLSDLEVLAAASMELLTTALANIPEPRRGKLVNGFVGDHGGRCCPKARVG